MSLLSSHNHVRCICVQAVAAHILTFESDDFNNRLLAITISMAKVLKQSRNSNFPNAVSIMDDLLDTLDGESGRNPENVEISDATDVKL